MKCSCCGKEISQDERYCNFCGQNNPYFVEQRQQVVVQRRNNEYNHQPKAASYSYTQANSYQSAPAPQPAPQPVAQPTRESSALSICALIFAILGGWVGLVLGIVGVCVNKDPDNKARCTAAIYIFAIEATIAFVFYLAILLA